MSSAPTSESSSAGSASWLPAHKVTAWDAARVRSDSRIDNSEVYGRLAKDGNYLAYEQRAGDYVSVQDNGQTYTNYYWVYVKLNDQVSGWVSAVYLTGGRNNYPHPHVQPVIPDLSEYS